MSARVLLIMLLMLHPLAGLAAGRSATPATADACGPVCCCGAGCDCFADAPAEPTEPAPVAPQTRPDTLSAPDVPATPAATWALERDPRRAPTRASIPAMGALERARLLCVWRT